MQIAFLNRNCPRLVHYKLQKQGEVYETPKLHTSPTDKEIWKYQMTKLETKLALLI